MRETMALKRMEQMRKIGTVEMLFLRPIVGYGMVVHKRKEDTNKSKQT
jgi:hypothetical protein